MSESKFKFTGSDEQFAKAFVEFADVKKAKSMPAATGKQIFKWEGITLNHVSVKDNKVDYLVYKNIVICSFGIGRDRNKIYEFLEKHWVERIHPFIKYINKRREDEDI